MSRLATSTLPAQVAAVISQVADAAMDLAELEASLSDAEELTFDRVLPIARARQHHELALNFLAAIYKEVSGVDAS